jgi:LCP family protein required for cell wall assembly
LSGDQAWGPTVGGGGRRVGRRLFQGLVVLVLLALVAVVLLGLWLNAQIPREDVDGLASGGGPMHVLVAGTDRRGDLSREEQLDLGVGGAEGERADTIFVMTIRGGDVALLAFPRDLWVERCDGTTGRINVAISAGPGCLVETVRDLSGIEINHFMRVTFGGFVDVVDAVGGVELCLEQAISDRDAHIDLPAGCQELDGRDALGYVRVRKIDDDLGRIGRQQEFLQALAREVGTPSTLLNPLRLYRLGDEAGDAISLDQRLGLLGMLRLARGARGLAGGNAVTHVVPGTPERRGDAAVLIPDELEAEQLFARFRDGSVLDEARTGVAPEDVRVSVYNGAEVSGLAGRIGELLQARGYEVVEVGNTDSREDTLVRHPPGERDAAELVAGDIPGDTTIEESSDVTHLTVLLGPPAGGA